MYKLLVSLLALSITAGAQVGGSPGVTGGNGSGAVPQLVVVGTGGGNINLTQGAAHTAPVNGFGLQAPTSIPTGYIWTAPSADCNGGLNVSADVIACNLTGTSAAFATATTAGTCVQSTTAIVGATTSMVAVASPVSTPGVGAQWSAFVSSAGNVTINECAVAVSAGGTIAFNIRLIP